MLSGPLWGITLVGMVSLAGCSSEEGSFADYPGFADYYARYPPQETIPDAGERKLLEAYRPRIHLAADEEGPLDFYLDYVAHGTLRDEDNRVLSRNVGREDLNAVRNTLARFVHEPSSEPVRPVVYGRIDRETFRLDGSLRRFTFLTYNLVFRHSGVPAGLTGIRALVLALAGDLDDWHQLDHYTAVTLALDEDLYPRAVLFQQHNYVRSYLFGETQAPGRLVLPADGRLAVDVAIRSNELYPHRPGRTERRAVGFMSRDTVRYLVLGEGTVLAAAPDVTDSTGEIEFALTYLPPSDAFYTFRGWLGEHRCLPGRDGPPGADFSTLPAFKPRWIQMVAFHWWDGDRKYVEWWESLTGERWALEPDDLDPLMTRFANRLATG